MLGVKAADNKKVAVKPDFDSEEEDKPKKKLAPKIPATA